jgi:WD40 repeat protein
VLWDVTDLGRPKRLSQFEGGQPVALSPGGRTVATITYHGQAVLWNVADPRHPVEMTTLSNGDGTQLEELAFSPDGKPFSQRDLAFSPDGTVLASATGTDQVTLWKVTDPARAYRLATVSGLGDFIQAFTFSSRGNLLGAVTYHGAVLVYSLADPARPVRTAAVRSLLTRALFPSGLPRPSETPLCAACSGLGDYAVAFARTGTP